jgi:hypothetical protein
MTQDDSELFFALAVSAQRLEGLGTFGAPSRDRSGQVKHSEFMDSGHPNDNVLNLAALRACFRCSGRFPPPAPERIPT